MMTPTMTHQAQEYQGIRTIMEALRSQIRQMHQLRQICRNQRALRAILHAQRHVNAAHSKLYDALEALEKRGHA